MVKKLSILAVSFVWLLSPCLAQTQERAAVLNITNAHRLLARATPLVENRALDAAAQKFAEYLATHAEFGHFLAGSPVSRAQQAGYPSMFVGENIARGFSTPESVMSAWLSSAGHRANILDPRYSEIGIGVADGPYGRAWVQDFGRRTPSVIPPTPERPAPPVLREKLFRLFVDPDGTYRFVPVQPDQ